MKRIDISQIIAQKSPKLARRMPRWVVRSLERLICAQKLNHILDNYSDRDPIGFIGASLDYIGVSYTLHGTDNIPTGGKRLIFGSNHPLGGLDGLILAHGLANTMPEAEIKLIVNDLLMNVEPLRPIFVPVNKHGAQGAHYAQAQKDLYSSDSSIITFPCGLCSRLIGGKIIDVPWKRSFVTKAAENDRRVIPTYISGRNSMTFYRTALWRKRLGIKANIEMILLPREMFGQRGKHIDIYFGQPVTVDLEQHTAKEWTEIIRTEAYALAPPK